MIINTHNKTFVRWIILSIFSVISSFCQAQINLSALLLNQKSVQLTINATSECQSSYTLFRAFPQQPFEPIATIEHSQTTYIDSLPYIICNDTIRYTLQSLTCQSDTIAILIVDNQPTSECTKQLASVNDTTQLISLTWAPNPDPDIMGYYLCSGFPCADYDTIWGNNNNHYICVTLPATQQYTFRLLAFDSCMQASPLTPPMGNIVLQLSADTLTRRISAQWNPYLNMPGDLLNYAFCTRSNFFDSWDTVAILPPSQVNYNFNVSNQEAFSLQAKVVALSHYPELQSSSNTDSVYFPALVDPNPGVDPQPTTDTLVAYIPNVFTPTQPTNNTFCPTILDVDENNYIIFIYNRQGTLVFSTNNLNNCWNGKSSQGQPCPQGVYTYTIRVRRYTGGLNIINGQILLLR